MDHLTCDLCDRGLYHDVDVRYVVKIEVTAAYDVLELTESDFAKDHEAEIDRILRDTESMTEEELEAQIHKRFELDLCATCQKRFLADPLGRTRR